MFQLHMEWALQLLVLVAACMLFVMASREGVCCKFLHKLVGTLVVIAVLALMVCTGVRTYGFMKEVGYKMPPMGRGMMHHKMMMSPEMMEGMKDCDCPMMKMMKEKMGGEEKPVEAATAPAPAPAK